MRLFVLEPTSFDVSKPGRGGKAAKVTKRCPQPDIYNLPDDVAKDLLARGLATELSKDGKVQLPFKYAFLAERRREKDAVVLPEPKPVAPPPPPKEKKEAKPEKKDLPKKEDPKKDDK